MCPLCSNCYTSLTQAKRIANAIQTLKESSCNLSYVKCLTQSIGIFKRGDSKEGFLIVSSAADKGQIDIHDRCPLVLSPEVATDWMQPNVSSDEAEVFARERAVPADEFA
ncbi:SOS response-associated peptidase family protein (plasmid) [Enterobacter mori]